MKDEERITPKMLAELGLVAANNALDIRDEEMVAAIHALAGTVAVVGAGLVQAIDRLTEEMK